jgi:hypothetical protein
VKRDNSTFGQKIALRRSLLGLLPERTFILEAYAGLGDIYRACYTGYPGAAMDKEEARVEYVASERPNWIAVAGDNAAILAAGFLADAEVGLFDLDAYGSPLGCLDGILQPGRKFAAVSYLVATDGIGQKLRMGSADVKRLRPYTEKYGEDFVRHNYKTVLAEIIQEGADRAGLSAALIKFYTCGAGKQMAHWAVRLQAVNAQVSVEAPVEA